jgi:O-methyltransferase involved in polyketide biosynthesis
MMASTSDSSRISPTAHYTAQVWFRHGMSHPALSTSFGRTLYAALRPANLAYRLTGRPNLDEMLLARHRSLDWLLEREISSGRVGQVIEVAAGLSPRGLNFTRRFPELLYIEADLPEMAAHKRRALDRAGRTRHHQVAEIDALADAGPTSIGALARTRLDSTRGTAILTEGLISYFARDQVEAMWRRFAAVLRTFPHGKYFSDLNTADHVRGMHTAKLFRRVLQVFARGRVHLHFPSASEASAALLAAGFADVQIHRPNDLDVDFPGRDRRHVVRIIEGTVFTI